jgi:hypothetical protein
MGRDRDTLKPGDTVYIRVGNRDAKVVSVDGNRITVKPSWSLFQRTLSRYELQSTDEWLEGYRQKQTDQHEAAMAHILGSGQIPTDDLVSRLDQVATTVRGAERDRRTDAIEKLVAVVGPMLGKIEMLQERIDAQDKEIEQLHKWARGERRL